MKVINYLFIVIGLVLMINLTSAISITQIFPTLSPYVTNQSNVLIQYNFTTDYLNNLTLNWDGTNYSIYDDSLVLFYNFDNRSALGENDTHVVDLSKYGNNGTVIGGENISWTPNGKYGGAFNSTANSFINISDSDSLAYNYTAMTWSFWVQQRQAEDLTGWLSKYKSSNNQRSWLITHDFTNEVKVSLSMNLTSGSSYSSNLDCGITSYNTWTNIQVVYNGTNLFYYKNGILCDSDSVIQTKIIDNTENLYIGYNSFDGRYMNGSIDDVMIFNKSLSVNELSQLYKSQLTKYNSTNWDFQTNQSLNANLNSTTTSYDWDYYLCSSNSSSSENCTSQNTITQTIPNKNVIANFSSLHKNLTINPYGSSFNPCLYGNLSYASDNTECKIDINNDGTRDTQINKVWMKDKLSNLNNGWARATISFHPEYANTTDISGVNFTGDYSDLQNLLISANENNFKVLLQIKEVPSWLGVNFTGGLCGGYPDEANCSASNYTKYANIIYDATQRITNNFEYIDHLYYEIGNEPQLSGWDVSNWTLHYNNIWDYTKIKDNRISLGGGGCLVYDTNNENFCLYTLANMTNRDFYSFHHAPTSAGYIGTTKEDNIKLTLDWLTSNCVGNCSTFIQSEGYINSALMTNQSSRINEFGTNIANKLIEELNYNNSYNVYDIYYQFTEEFSYINNSATYPEYPTKFHMVLDPQLQSDDAGEITIPYNVTKNFAHLCPAGGTVYQSSSDDDSIKTVSCKDGNKYNIIVINTGTESKNISIDTNGLLNRLENYETGEVYYSNSPFDLGVMDSYEILYLTSGETSDNNLMCRLKLNENNGTISYDSSGNNNNGIISGATWQNDGVLKTLVNGVDYTINPATGLLTMSSDYLYSWIVTGWSYYQIGRVTDANNILTNVSTGVTGFFVNINPVYAILAVLVIILVLIVLIRTVNPETKQNVPQL